MTWWKAVSFGPLETRRLGGVLARGLKPGDVVALTGGLGAGKTTFIQGLARGLGVKEKYLFSPTFVLIREYRGRLPFFHVDLYRIGDEKEAVELGLEEMFQGAGVTAVEWAERAAAILPARAIRVRLEMIDPRRRRIFIRPARIMESGDEDMGD